ncbi:MAG: hypothetical protein ABJR46_18515 [Tateyamaria sp.]|uniref:hypothetical protein n=1 Tax=Tateyamaria sp. TaxID=1929288 RepID=UPI00329E2C95
MDRSVVGATRRYLHDVTLPFLAMTLAGQDEQTTVVTTHHLPIIGGFKAMDIQNLRESKQLKSILSDKKGELRLTCVHTHRNIAAPFDNVVWQNGAGVSRADSTELKESAPNCLTKEPDGFFLHDVCGGIINHHAPVGDYDGPFLFYPNRWPET